jgi:hypothetical protein
MMNADQFWNIIETSRQRLDPLHASGNMERQLMDLRRLLLKLPPKQIIDFRDCFHEQMDIAFRWDLWGAAYIIASGCSNDGFAYFRHWLISMGQHVFQEALVNPESLAGVADTPGVEDVFFEEFSYVPAEAYEETTGRELPPYKGPTHPLPKGDKWSSAGDDLKLRFPVLWARYQHSS